MLPRWNIKGAQIFGTSVWKKNNQSKDIQKSKRKIPAMCAKARRKGENIWKRMRWNGKNDKLNCVCLSAANLLYVYYTPTASDAQKAWARRTAIALLWTLYSTTTKAMDSSCWIHEIFAHFKLDCCTFCYLYVFFSLIEFFSNFVTRT